MLILFGAACVGVLVEAFVAARSRHTVQFVLSPAGAGRRAGHGDPAGRQRPTGVTADVALAIDGPALFLQGTLVVLGIVALLLIGRALARARRPVRGPGRGHRRQRRRPASRPRETGGTEVFPLTLFALGGMMLFVAANDLLTMFVALEVFSLPLYLLCALARRRRLLSARRPRSSTSCSARSPRRSSSSAWPCSTASPAQCRLRRHPRRRARNSTTSPLLLFAGLAMLSVGLLFKAAAVPFHVWTPDVYQGAPTPVTALMAACTKVAAFGGLLRVLYVGFDRVAVGHRSRSSARSRS